MFVLLLSEKAAKEGLYEERMLLLKQNAQNRKAGKCVFLYGRLLSE